MGVQCKSVHKYSTIYFVPSMVLGTGDTRTSPCPSHSLGEGDTFIYWVIQLLNATEDIMGV